MAGFTDDTACERLVMADMLGLTGLREIVLQYAVSTRERLRRIQGTEGYARLGNVVKGRPAGA